MSNKISIQLPPSALSSDLPRLFAEESLSGSDVISATGDFGQLCMQSIIVNGIGMYYTVGDLLNDIRLQITGINSVFILHIPLQGFHEAQSHSFQHSFTHTNQYSLLFPTGEVTYITLQKQASFRTLTLIYPLAFIKAILNHYPALEELEDKLDTGEAAVSFDNTIPVLVAEKIYALLHTPFTMLTKEYFRRLFREIVEIVFAGYTPSAKPASFNLHDISCIHAAKEYIDTHLLEHLTIAQLSRKAGINQLKLKKGFKSIYGIGVYGYQLQQRMLIAKTALEKTLKPIHQVARQSGYKSAANFSAAFKKIYGISPYRYRLQMRQNR